MTLYLHEQEIRKQSREEGRQEGLRDGEKIGVKRGKTQERHTAIRRMAEAGIGKKKILEMRYTQKEYNEAMKEETEF